MFICPLCAEIIMICDINFMSRLIRQIMHFYLGVKFFLHSIDVLNTETIYQMHSIDFYDKSSLHEVTLNVNLLVYLYKKEMDIILNKIHLVLSFQSNLGSI